MEWLALPLVFLSIAFIINGFNFVTIHKHYHGKGDE